MQDGFGYPPLVGETLSRGAGDQLDLPVVDLGRGTVALCFSHLQPKRRWVDQERPLSSNAAKGAWARVTTEVGSFRQLVRRFGELEVCAWQEVALLYALEGQLFGVGGRDLGESPGSTWYIPPQGQMMYLKGYSWVKVFKTATPDGYEEYWATSRLDMRLEEVAEIALYAWQIEVYHQGLKQFTGIK